MKDLSIFDAKKIIYDTAKAITPEAEKAAALISSAVVNKGGYSKNKKSVITLTKNGSYATSKKAKNLYLDWRILLSEISESALLVCGAETIPILLPLAGLVVVVKLCNLATIKISKNHAIILWVMWNARLSDNTVIASELPKSVNEKLNELKRKTLSNKDIKKIVDDLILCKCIQYINNGDYRMIEKVSLDL